MIYQLPNGKIIYLTVEQYLRLTDDDIKYIDEQNIGSSTANPFEPFKNSNELLEDEEPLDNYLDIPSDDDDTIPIDQINLDLLFDED